MSIDKHLAALRSYNAAIDGLYESPVAGRLASDEESTPTPASDGQRIKALLEASRNLAAETTTMLADQDPNVRASGQARLASLAAKDIAIAFDIARLDDEERALASTETPDSALQSVEREVEFMLEGDPRDGVPELPKQAGGAQLAAVEQDPLEALRAALPRALDSVRDEATSIVVDGIRKLAGSQIHAVVGKLADGLLKQVPDKIKRWYKWAVELLKEGIKKLVSLLGEGFQDAVQAARTWLLEYAPKKLADGVYGVPAISKELASLLGRTATSEPTKDWAKVEREIEAVVGKFKSVAKVVRAIFKAIGFARDWALRAIAPPAGEILVDGTFVLGALFGLFAGGDYIDWHRTHDDGAFDFVRGVRRTAEAELLA
jgi:hypothetical protein